jgi:hypothetical protein
MNKTLLLILCDFLLLSLLALTRWEDARPSAPTSARPATAAPPADAATPETDLVATMKLSLEDEQARRIAVADDLARTEAARAEAEAAKARLANDLLATEKTAAALGENLAVTRAAAGAERARNEALALELAAREAEAKRREADLARVSAAEGAARARAESLAVDVGVARREKELLAAQTEALKTEVAAERAERQRVQAATTELAAGVGEMAERTGALTKEFREARPINANTLFGDFLARRVSTRFAAGRSTFFGSVTRDADARTVLVGDGKDVVALLHVDDTPFDWRAAGQPDWARLELTLARDGGSVTAGRVNFLSLDPRVVAVPLTADEARRLGGEPYLLALEPFKFPEAVLISAGGTGYGELPFKLDPQNPGYVAVDNRLLRRLFGDFAPNRGDLVLSKTGELLGVMVTADRCALVTNFLPQRSLPLGPDLAATPTGPLLDAVSKRFLVLPATLK